MRGVLSSSQMALPGTLPCKDTYAHMPTQLHSHTHTHTHPETCTYTHLGTCTRNAIMPPTAPPHCTSNCCCLSASLTPSPTPLLHPSPALSSLHHSSLAPSLAAAYPCRSAADVTTHQLGEQQGRRREKIF